MTQSRNPQVLAGHRPDFLWNPTRNELVTTKFMRNRLLFTTLAQEILPRLRREKNRPLRMLFWACSTGAEPFTLKYLLGADCQDQITGIDFDADAVSQAQQGICHPDTWTMFFDGRKKLLTDAEVTELFEPAGIGAGRRVSEKYRQNVSFQTGDLFSATPAVPENHFDLVICNNLLLHLKDHSANAAFDYLLRYVNDDGLLLVAGCNPKVRAAAAKRLNLLPLPDKLAEISRNWAGVSGAWNFPQRPAWACPEPQENDPDFPFLAGELFRRNPEKLPEPVSAPSLTLARPKNIVITGSAFWNPGDDFVREGVIRVLQNVFDRQPLNFLFYNFNPDALPQAGALPCSNLVSQGDLEKFRDRVDAIVVVGVSAGHELKPLYRWVLANDLASKVYLISGHYESAYAAEHIIQEPEASIFRQARFVIGRTNKFPGFIRDHQIPYHRVNCPALLSVHQTKQVPAGKRIERIGFSIQLPKSLGGILNQDCAESAHQLALDVLMDLSKKFSVEIVAHHKTEYFYYLDRLRDTGIPVIFSSFYHDLFATYKRYDLVITTRLHTSLFANGHGIPGIIINNTDRHTHALEGFQHSSYVTTRAAFETEFARWQRAGLAAVARELDEFKSSLLAHYVRLLRPVMHQETCHTMQKDLPTAAVLDTAGRILFVRTDSIGDAVIASGMLQPLKQRYPNAQLAVLCQAHVAELFAACPHVNSVICYDRRKVEADPAERAQILAEIAAFRPDVVLNSVRSRDKFSDDLTLAIQGAHHIAIEGDLNNITEADRHSANTKYETVIPSSTPGQPELQRHAEFLRGLGVDAVNLQPAAWTSPDDELLADEFFKQQQLDSQKTIALFPGAQHEVRVYHGYAAALKNLDGFRFLIFGDASQTGLARQLELQLPGRTVNLCGRSTLRETVALVRRCRLYVGAESAGAHIACAVGVPNVVLLGGGHFGRFMPYSPLTSAVALPLDCFDCNWRCKHKRAHCIKDVRPEIIAEAVRQALEKSSVRPRVFLQAEKSWKSGATLPAWQRPDVQLAMRDVEFIEVPETQVSTVIKMADAEIVGVGISNPIVSVVISTYASEKFIGNCLENLSRQTIFDRLEVIVVDSGSPENERAIVEGFQQRFPNIRYVRTPRETLYAAWNRALQLARGRYFANVNTDDSLRNDALEILAASLDKHADCALSYADCAWTKKPNDTFPSSNIIKTVKYPDYTPLETLFYCLTGCLQFFRTESLRSVRGFDPTLKCAGDYEATLKLMAARMNAVHVPEVLSLFFQNVTGLTQAGNRAAVEHDAVMDRYREQLDIANIFQIDPADNHARAAAMALLGVRASKFSVPWEKNQMAHNDFAFACFNAALQLDAENEFAGMNLLALARSLNRLNQNMTEYQQRWPKMRQWLAAFNSGERVMAPALKHTLLGPVFRPLDNLQRPAAELLAREPQKLRPWISRIDGRHVYLSEDLFPRPAGLVHTRQELDAAAKQLVSLLGELPNFYAHFGGAGDALLLLASFYDEKPDAVLFSHPNGTGAARALFDAFPKLSKIYFLPQHTEPFFHIILRYAVYELRNCAGAGTTPKFGYDEEWKASLDIVKKYRIKKSPRWAAAFRKNENSKRVAVAPKGSLTGMVGSKRNLILPEQWPQVLVHILERGFEPVILGTPDEATDYPALPGCMDARRESFPGQMRVIGECAGLVGADSWAKSFSALAEIPTLVFEPTKGSDLGAWKDPSDWVFIEPWPSIKMISSLEDFRRQFDVLIAKISRPPEKTSKPVIAWEGSFLDYGSLSHINRELTTRMPEVVCVGSNILPERAKKDADMNRCAKRLSQAAPKNACVIVRHQWPPNWSRPASGALVVIQPWEFGALPQAWVNQSTNVDEFWVPSPIVRSMYVNSGIAPEKVRVVPNGVDVKKFTPHVDPLKLQTKKKFKFLFVGGTIYRKGPDVLLETFSQAFAAQDDVCLVIKDFGGDSFYQGQTAEKAIQEIQKRPAAPEIVYLNTELSSEQMPALYAACDCLVLPYRGEGFGLPVLEAMSCGRPVIVTAGGATDYFVTSECGWKIPSQGVYIGDRVGDIPLAKHGWLLEPSKANLVAIMKFAAANPAECRRRGAAGRAIVERKFDWNDVAAEVSHRLRELGEKFAPKIIVPEVAPKKIVPQKIVPVPAVAKIGRLDEARELFAQKNYEAAWNAGIAAIAQRPFHPDAFLLLAETARAAGDAGCARKCAERALKLAPNFEVAKKFLKQKFNGSKVPGWQLPPAGNPRISVCLITKNEEKFLAQCLRSVRGLASQVIVADTGSNDRTVEIAKEFGAEIYAFPWCDDFAAARNAAIEHASGDWILILDADEELPAAQHARLLEDIKNSTKLGFRLPLVNHGQENEGRSFIPRLFRNAPGVFYHGRIHEQVFPSLLPLCKKFGMPTALGSAEILHHGYTKEMVRDRNKVERNLHLLHQAIAENPADANLLMNLGLELVRSEKLPEGIAQYRAAFELMSAQPANEIVPELREALLAQFTSQLYKVHAHDEVVRVVNSPLAKNGMTASLHLALGLSLFELKNFAGAAEQMSECLAKKHEPTLTPVNVDIFSAAPWHCLALCRSRTGDLAGADAAFQSAIGEPVRNEEARLDYAKFLRQQNRPVDALHQLNEVITRNPRNANAWNIGGEISLGHPEFLEFARDWTGEACKHLPENSVITAQRAEVLLLSGEISEALGLWQKVWKKAQDLEHDPRSLAALILCEAVELPGTHAPDDGNERATSLAFIEWYRRLITMRAGGVVAKLNGNIEKLSRALPTAADMIGNALAEAGVAA